MHHCDDLQISSLPAINKLYPSVVVMVHNLRKGGVVAAFMALCFPISVLSALQNITIDDQDFTRITYMSSTNWKHDPLIGYEYEFNNGSRSYTYVPGASASLSFTG
jgi:hypothetical protein